MLHKLFSLKLLSLLFLVNSNYYSQIHHHKDSHGVVDFKIDCSKESKNDFNKAMILLHHMTYPQAREAFKELTIKDPTCAMADWGFAMTLFQPLWPTRPGPGELKQGSILIQKAKSLQSSNERDRLLILAAEKFFQDPKSADYWKRIQDWKSGMETAYSAFPDDNEVAAFYALALLATVPPDKIYSSNNKQAADILLKILNENPDHPGAMHYLIHANDTPGREKESLEILTKYYQIAPDNPHALHMPTHIYTRLGNWNEVIEGNIKAANAALKFPAGDNGEYTWDEFPHAIEYMVYALLQKGNDNEAAAQIKRLRSVNNLEPTFKTAFHISSTKARYTLERNAWKEASEIDPVEPGSIDWNRYPWAEAIGWFARGFGSANIDDITKAKESLQHLAELEKITSMKKELLFARNIRVLNFELLAEIADEEGNTDSALILLTQAAELESETPKHAVTPAPTIPAYELLGDFLFKHGKFDDALTAYKQSLENNPGRFNSLLGAARTLRAMGDITTSILYYQQLLGICDKNSPREGYKEASDFLKK